MQIFGVDSVLGRGEETEESREQWVADMDVDVSLAVLLHTCSVMQGNRGQAHGLLESA